MFIILLIKKGIHGNKNVMATITKSKIILEDIGILGIQKVKKPIIITAKMIFLISGNWGLIGISVSQFLIFSFLFNMNHPIHY